MPRIKDWRIYVCQWPGSYSLLASIGKLSLFVFTLPVSKSLPRKIVSPFSCLSPVMCVPCLSDLFELLPVREFECSIAKEFIP